MDGCAPGDFERAGTWSDLVQLASRLAGDTALEASAERLCRDLVDKHGPALRQPRRTFLSEDFFVFSINALEQPLAAEQLLAAESGYWEGRFGRIPVRRLPMRRAVLMPGDRRPQSRLFDKGRLVVGHEVGTVHRFGDRQRRARRRDRRRPQPASAPTPGTSRRTAACSFSADR